jgi:hypothetical protein
MSAQTLVLLPRLADLIAPQTPSIAQKHPLVIAGVIVAVVVVAAILALRAIRKKP